jgi:hypothetical protein
MALLFVHFLGLQVDGGRLQLSPELNTEQAKELARALGFDLAPGESLDITYEFNFIREDRMSVHVNDIASNEDFLSRFYPEAKLEWQYDDEKYDLSAYTLYGNNDITFSLHHRSAWFDINEPMGIAALTLTREFHGRNDIRDRFVFALPVILLIGWLIELGLIAIQTILWRKTKKEQSQRSTVPEGMLVL